MGGGGHGRQGRAQVPPCGFPSAIRFDGHIAVSNSFRWTDCRRQFVLMDGLPSAIQMHRGRIWVVGGTDGKAALRCLLAQRIWHPQDGCHTYKKGSICHCPSNMAPTRQSRPDSGLDFQAKVLKTFPSSLRSGRQEARLPCRVHPLAHSPRPPPDEPTNNHRVLGGIPGNITMRSAYAASVPFFLAKGYQPPPGSSVETMETREGVHQKKLLTAIRSSKRIANRNPPIKTNCWRRSVHQNESLTKVRLSKQIADGNPSIETNC